MEKRSAPTSEEYWGAPLHVSEHPRVDPVRATAARIDPVHAAAIRIGAIAAFGAVLLSETAPALSNALLVPAVIGTAYLLLCTMWARHQMLTVWTILMIVLVGVTALLVLIDGPQSWGALGRYALGFSCFALALAGRTGVAVGTRLIPVLAAGLILMAVLYTLANGLIIAADYPRFAPFYGGELGLHSSALAVCAATTAVFFSSWRPMYRWLWTGLGVFMLVGYSTVTVLIMMFMILASSLFLQRRWPLWILGVLSVVVFTAAVLFRDRTASTWGGGVAEEGLGSVGSGRLGSWMERLDLFIERPLLRKLIGGGPASDSRPTGLWWWEPKVAHSEILTVVMEYGVYGLLTAILYFGVLIRLTNIGQKLVLVAFMVGAALSNIILERPTLALVWGFVLLSMYTQNRLIAPIHSRTM